MAKDFKRFLNLLAFIGIITVALALILAKIASGSTLGNALTIVANAIAYFITAIGAFYYAKSRGNIWYLVAYFVAIILVIVFMILNA